MIDYWDRVACQARKQYWKAQHTNVWIEKLPFSRFDVIAGTMYQVSSNGSYRRVTL